MQTPGHTSPSPTTPAVPDIPDGFEPLREPPGFVAVNGPLYVRYQRGVEGQPETNLLQLGFRVEARHCNPTGKLHGGMMATFCDMLMATKPGGSRSGSKPSGMSGTTGVVGLELVWSGVRIAPFSG